MLCLFVSLCMAIGFACVEWLHAFVWTPEQEAMWRSFANSLSSRAISASNSLSRSADRRFSISSCSADRRFSISSCSDDRRFSMSSWYRTIWTSSSLFLTRSSISFINFFLRSRDAAALWRFRSALQYGMTIENNGVVSNQAEIRMTDRAQIKKKGEIK